jgi:hypothetical protein
MASTNDLLSTESSAIIRTGADGRQRYDEDYKRQVLGAFDRSGMSGKAFAEQCGVKYPTFASWLAKRRGAPAGDGKGNAAGPAFLLAEIGTEDSQDALEIILPGGVLARAATPRQARLLAELVKALA